MTFKQMISVTVTVGSVWLGGSLGAAALEKANAAPLANDVQGGDLSIQIAHPQPPRP